MIPSRPLLIFAVVVASAACMLQTVGLASTDWMQYSKEGHHFELGLWRSCVDYSCGNTVIFAKQAQFTAVRAFAVLGLLAGLAALTGIFVQLAKIRIDLKFIRLPTAIFTIAALACVTISVACFVTWLPSEFRKYLSWSFYLSAVAMGLFALDILLVISHFFTDIRSGYTSAI